MLKKRDRGSARNPSSHQRRLPTNLRSTAKVSRGRGYGLVRFSVDALIMHLLFTSMKTKWWFIRKHLLICF